MGAGFGAHQIKQSLDYAASLGETAQQLGVTAKELQEYRFIATQVGITQEDMDGGLSKLTKSLGQAQTGASKQAEAFDKLGISLRSSNGDLKTAGDALPEIAEKLKGIESPAQRASIEIALFGKTGQKLDNILTMGAKGIKEYRDEAHRLGVVLSDDLIKKADDAADKMATLNQQLTANISKAVSENANAILNIAGAIQTAVVAAVNFINTYPKFTAALAGAAIGARYGVPGAVAGAGLGFFSGQVGERASADSNMDVGFRKQQLASARAELAQRQKAQNDPGALFSIRRSSADGGNLQSQQAEVKRQEQLMATALASAAVAQNKPLGVPTLDVSDFNRSGTNSRRSARTGNKDSGPSAADQQDAYNEAMDRLLSDELRNRQSLAKSAEESAALELQRVDLEKAHYESALNKDVADKKITEADAISLRLKNAENVDQEKAIIKQELGQVLLDQQTEYMREGLDQEATLLSIRESMAKTNTERRKIQLALLELEIEEKGAAARRLINTGNEKEIAEGRQQLEGLADYRAGKEKSIEQGTMTPLQQYLDTIPKTQDEINERFNKIAADGLSSFNEGLVAAGTNLIGLKGLAGSLFNQLISDLLRFQIQAATRSIFGDGGGFLSGLGGLFGGGGTAMSAGFNASFDATFAKPLPGLAVGGDILIGGNSGIDKNVLSINGRPTAMVGRGEVISVTPTNDNRASKGRTEVHVVPSPYFDVRVTEIAAPMSINAAQAGSMGAQKAIASRQKRSIR
ncbi:MAG: phage tail tape measure protein [Xanthomonadales bacterium]|nr:phage tail tape measure protein [Xanthomonadales bacterium]